MKHTTTKLIIFFLIECMFFSNCEKNDEFALKDFSQSECKSSLKSSSPERIHLKMIKKDLLLIEHLDTYFCCLDPGVTLEASIVNGNHILVNEMDKLCIVDCICKYDLTFKLSGIKNGENTISILRGSLEKFSCTLNLTSRTDTTILINPL
jgi:hypothetical protein